MNILLVEDLDSYFEAIRDGFESRLNAPNITRISTELEFRCQLPQLEKQAFDVAIFDVMINWCTPEDTITPEGMNVPAEVLEEIDSKRSWRSGVRCRRMFQEARKKADSRPVHCIHYSVLDIEDLRKEISDEEVELIGKSGDIEPLVRAIRRAVERV